MLQNEFSSSLICFANGLYPMIEGIAFRFSFQGMRYLALLNGLMVEIFAENGFGSRYGLPLKLR